MMRASLRPDRATVVAALAARRLDKTLTTALPVRDPADGFAVGSTGLARLDAGLDGGWPRGQLSELVGPASSGRTSVCLAALAAATARGELVAVIDALDRLDVESLIAAGVDLQRLLWIRGHVVANPGLCADTNRRAMDQAIKALTLVLQAGNFGVVVFDAGDAPAEALRHLPFTTWLRLQRMVEGSQTICLLIGHEPMARSSSGLTIVLGGRDAGARFIGRLFGGLEIHARVIRARARAHEHHLQPMRLTSEATHG
jgi:recombination protein RecA